MGQKAKVEKVYVDTFMTEEEEDDQKKDFDPVEALNSFIIKKDYFVMHRQGDIFNDYEIETNPVGEGGFGTVYKGYERESGELRAIKKIPFEKIINYQNACTLAARSLDQFI